mmetsp:Transcript_25188/g.55207  ORF Transcript_25188/g.55207 Transcript_25188/m.55207 type:complete len:228 (-) Transcript_25188:76-759(-)
MEAEDTPAAEPILMKAYERPATVATGGRRRPISRGNEELPERPRSVGYQRPRSVADVRPLSRGGTAAIRPRSREGTGRPLSRASLSASQLRAVSTSQTQPKSMGSKATHASAASVKEVVAEVVQKQLEASRLDDYLRVTRRSRDKPDPAQALKINPINMNAMPDYTSIAAEALREPVRKATDPKWSSGLKEMDEKIRLRLTYNCRVSAIGAVVPERHHLAGRFPYPP